MDLVTVSDVAEMLRPTSPTGTVSRKRADQISRRQSFPAPVQVTRTGRLWDRDAVAAWIRDHRQTSETEQNDETDGTPDES